MEKNKGGGNFCLMVKLRIGWQTGLSAGQSSAIGQWFSPWTQLHFSFTGF